MQQPDSLQFHRRFPDPAVGAGRNRVNLRQAPNSGNNHTAVLSINDDQGGGGNYAFEVTWRAEGDRPNGPAPFFDDIRVCEYIVRQRFLSKNGRSAEPDFDGFADRQSNKKDRELIQGRGNARNWNDARDITYSCEMDTRTGKVRSADYRYSSSSARGSDRNRLK